jgi:hypothetical protein
MTPQLLRVRATLRHADAARVGEIFPPARRAAMLDAILAGEAAAPASGWAERRRGRRLPVRRAAVPAFAVLLACVLAAVVVVVVTSSARHAKPSGGVIHTSPVSFRYPARGPDSGYIIATVTDPFAAQSSLDAAFRAAGLDIAVTLVPASPSAVGTVVEISEPSSGPQIATLTGGSCVTGGGGPGNCPVGLKIPRDFSGSGSITLGRPTRPGETYESTNSAFAPGESLHCSGLIGATVATALPQLAATGITAQWQQQEPAAAQPGTQPVPTTTTPTATGAESTARRAAARHAAAIRGSTFVTETSPPPAGYHIVDGIPISPGVVMLQTQPDPLSATQLAQESQMYAAGC